MKFITYLALLGSAMGAKETVPAACADNTITESDCSRTVTISGVNFSYWVNLVDKVPTFHGHFDVPTAKQKVDGSSSNYKELRLCLELAKEGFEYEWREQIAFHSTLTTGKFDKEVKVLAKDWSKNKLDDYRFFCQQNEKSGSTPVDWQIEGAIKIDYEEIAQDSSKKDIFMDFQRPLIEEGAPNSMDLEPGNKYLLYISYYIGKDVNIKTSGSGKTNTKVNGEKGSGNNPKFVEIYLNTIKGLDTAGDGGTVYTVKAEATKYMTSLGAAAATMFAMY